MIHLRRIFAILSLLSLTILTAAGQEAGIYLDQSSFRELSTDALTNLAVDKIEKDRSNRPCARLKIRIDRMTPDEIRQTDVKLIGGNVMITKRINASSGNGIIVELTAREGVRLYLKHPSMGSSDIASISMEGNKEYQINAWGTRSQSITIACDRVGADVYVDGAYYGKISSSKMLTVPDVKSGNHKVKIMDGNDHTEETINVSSNQVYFAIALKNSASLQKYVVFEVVPSNAVIELDETVIAVKDGKAYKSLRYGTHSYNISAPRHHGSKGNINIGEDTPEPCVIQVNLAKAYGYLEVGSAVSGADVYVDGEHAGQAPLRMELLSGVHDIRVIKAMHNPYNQKVRIEDAKTVKITPELTANYAEVTITAENGAEIWVDMEKKGTGKWTGELGYGLYTVEVRKEGHRSIRTSHEVTSERSSHNLTLPELEAVTGTLAIESDPALADIYIDGVHIGKTPRRLDVIAGTRKVRISQKGYEDYTVSVNIMEGKEKSIHAAMKQAVKKPVRKMDTENMYQMGLGFESSYTTHSQFAFPIDFRIGRNDQIFNFFIGEAIGWDSSSEPSEYENAENDDYGSVTYLTTYVQARYNFLRDRDLRLFTYIGGNLHLNLSGKLEYSIINTKQDEVRSTVNINSAINPINYSSRAGIGFGGRVMELSIYCDYLIGNHFNMDYLNQTRDYDEEWKRLGYSTDKAGYDIITTNLAERNAGIWRKFSSRLSYGFSIKFYLFSGYEF